MKLLAAALAALFSLPAFPQGEGKGVGFKTVAAALESLTSRPDIQVSTTKPDGWTIASDPKNNIQWSFTPPGHYAHPAVVKRAIKQSPDGNIYIEMTALCEAEKTPCDRLIDEFNALNHRMRQNVQQRLKRGGNDR